MQVSSDAALIHQLQEPWLCRLAQHGVIRRYRSRTLLMQEGERGGMLFIVLAGRVKAFVRRDNREFAFGTFAAGEILGEWALDGGPRAASVITLECTVCAVLTLHTFQEQLHTDPQLLGKLLTRVIQRARSTSCNAAGLALHSVYQRVAELLESLAELREGRLGVFENLSHREIANRVGSSREMVTRILRDLQCGGYVRIEGKQLILEKRLPLQW